MSASTDATSAVDPTAALRAGQELDVTFASGVTGRVSFDPTYYDEDWGMVVVHYTSGFAAGVIEPVCDLGDAYLETDFLAGATVEVQIPHDNTSTEQAD